MEQSEQSTRGGCGDGHGRDARGVLEQCARTRSGYRLKPEGVGIEKPFFLNIETAASVVVCKPGEAIQVRNLDLKSPC